jgi:hypothetical protein
MIIGINGKIGSGKDTIGEIIRGLCLTNKDQVFEIKKFAGKLKQIGSILSGIPVEKFEDQEFKQKHMGLEWEMTYREFLQKLGTEAMRDGLHTNVWVNALFADYRLWSDGSKDWYPNWIITDMRFPNEMEAIVEKGGLTIRVVRNNNAKYSDKKVKSILKDMGYVDLSDGVWEELAINEGFTWFETFKLWTWDEDDNNNEALHPSETALDDAEFDYEIINDGSIEDLVTKVREILTKENII